MIDKAVILAAGRGNRISAVSKQTPKPLLPIDGPDGKTTFLDWHIAALSKIGVREIYLVGNRVTFNTQLAATEKVSAKTRVEWILNPTEDLSTSGSGHSMQYAWHSRHEILDKKSCVLLMDADIVYDASLLKFFASAKGEGSKTLVCSDYRETAEEVMVFADSASGRPRIHGKGLLRTPLVANMACVGEATGMVLWEPGDHEVLRAVTDWTIQYSTAKTRTEHEDVTHRLMSLDRMCAVPFARDYVFMEVDTPDEYRILVEEVFPKLRG